MNRTWILGLGLGLLGIALTLLLVVDGCTTLREVRSLRDVDFRIDRVSQAQLADVDLRGKDSFDDLSARETLRLGTALSDGTLPLSFTLHLEATNPPANDVTARLAKMDWTLLLEDEETLSGTFDRQIALPPGEPTDIPIDLELDLVRFFDDNLQGLVNLALALGGEGPPQNVKVRVQPTINTRVGPIEYPSPITVVSEDVGRKSPDAR